ncbi:hypothetical protein Patl1_15513 [Pistacia atlantica]|uniref:Uncharacterized protein n=1 Tax=Pistacia atlantica TaxID=434234 RepID=A0ACC1B7D4_9ROSI|nr:hypothetical protein Patl1_15513 [Pistacia atlantica]
MQKLFKTSHGYLYHFLKKNPTFVVPISHLHASTQTLDSDSRVGFIFNELEEIQSSNPNARSSSQAQELSIFSERNEELVSTVQISHPWPEWVDLMECLLKKRYFDGDGNPFNSKSDELGSKEANCIRTACLNFARDRFSLIRYFSRKDIQIIAGCGCPSIDRKVVNSGKRLRAHVGIDEGNVCSSCNLRGNCERAYVKAREDEGGRTVDVMRILLTYGLDPITGTVENKPCLNKLVKEAVRRLLKEMVECSTKEPDSKLSSDGPLKEGGPVQDHLSPQGSHINVPMKQGDWRCPTCNFLNFARNIRCLRCDGLFLDRLRQLREDQDHLPLKKGDWICDKCNFLNFAKNTRCLQCKENPPKRKLNPGEWECESCNYINFRRNMVCLKCDHRRLKSSTAPNTSAQSQYGNGGYHNRGGLKGINDKNELNYHNQVGQDRQSQNIGADMWRFVEEESEDDDQSNSRFVDFPIAGGKSELSRNPKIREKLKLEILERKRGTVSSTRENDDSSATFSQRRSDFIESTDDEDMAGWFGHK